MAAQAPGKGRKAPVGAGGASRARGKKPSRADVPRIGSATSSASQNRGGAPARLGGQRPTPRRAQQHVNRRRYGYPTVSERLAKSSRRMGPGKSRVIGSKIQHNASLGYISRGRRGSRRRAARAGAIKAVPYALGVVAVVLALWGVGTLVQNGLTPPAILAGGGDAAAPATALGRGLARGIAVPPDQASLRAQAPDAVVLGAGSATASGEGRVSFSAVGDNIANANLLELADAAAGDVGDDQYDFNAFYDGIRDAVQSYDISFINQETTLGGPDRYGYNGYPSFNTPDSMADAIAAAGWDVVSINSNHTYDTGEPAVQHSHGVWAGKADALIAIGSFASAEERARVRMVERNGVRIAFLAYSYGQNGYDQEDLPNDYYAVPYVKETMQQEVARAHEVADAVVVYMHWGTEYDHAPDEAQRAWAQELADAGVDVVVGSHAHVIQPMEWLEGAGGKTLVVYGLGDVWSGYHDKPECVLSGMMSCDFVRLDADAAKEAGRKVSVENVVWHPLIEHWQDGVDTVYQLSDYTEEQARSNELLAGLDDPYAWMQDLTRQVIGEDFAIDM